MTKPIINIDQLEFSRDTQHADKFEAKLAPVGMRIGAKKLGYNVTRLPAGKRAFPFHNHHANEEMFFILEGEGTLRFGQNEWPLRKGDFIACPPGGKDVAHQIINTGLCEMRYLAVSTMIDTDIFEYPDSGKWGAGGGRQANVWPPQATFPSKFVLESAGAEYWEGE